MKFEATFGVLIAFLLPGFICLYGLSLSYPDLQLFIDGTNQTTSSADFFYTTLASLSLGLVISAVRWWVLDKMVFGLFSAMKWPDKVDWDKLNDEKTLASFQFVVQNHYHYYQYYSNTFVALFFSAAAYQLRIGGLNWYYWLLIGFALAVLLMGSYDTLRNYYKRGKKILNV
jgi:hypothetical protein